MPNHIQNRLQIVGDKKRVKEILLQICDEEGLLDFNKIIPCPQIVKDVGEIHHGIVTAVQEKYMADVSTSSLVAILQLSSRAQVEEVAEKDKPDFEKACAAYEATGYCYWYDWNVAHWGTKWGAYDQPDKRTKKSKGEIWFQTAWSAPVKIMVKLTELFPDVKFVLSYADEDSGSNAGTITCVDGMHKVEKLPNQSNKAYELYFELHPDRRGDFELIDGKYEDKEN